MDGSLIALSEASDLLGVSSERVRQLVVAGELPGKRFGNAWVVPLEAVMARRHSGAHGGRPLGARRAWEEVISSIVRLERPNRYRDRARIVRCEMSRSDVAALRDAGALVSGVAGAIEYGARLRAVDGADLYVSESAFANVDNFVALVRDPLGDVRLRVIDDAVWAALPRGPVAPRGAVALDLLESGDPRHWAAASDLIGSAP